MNIGLWLKRIWLLIGLLILLSLLVTGVIFLVTYISSSNNTSGVLVGDDATPKGPDSLITQDLTFDRPYPVAKTDLMYIGVRIKQLSAPAPAKTISAMKFSMSQYRPQNTVNVVITKRDGSEAYPLLDRKAFIRTVDIPSPNEPPREYAVFDIAFFDTDHDGRINENDSSQLYISDLTGEHLTQVTPFGQCVRWYEKSPDGKHVFVLLQQRPASGNLPSIDWPERLCVIDTKTRTMSNFSTGTDTIEKIRKMLWQK